MTEALRTDFGFEPEPAALKREPQVLSRLVVVPPAPPWEQTRAANLEARHGAPLPLADLVHRVKRLAAWAPGRPGRFAVFYVRAKEYNAPFEAKAELDGQLVRMAFGLGGDQVRRAQGWVIVLLLFVLVGAILGVGGSLALSAKAQAEARLQAAETLSARKFAAAKALRAQAAQARSLRAALGRARSIEDLVGDLTWVATSKSPETRVAAVHWQAGIMAIEVRGDQPPFPSADRHLERAPQPLRPGIWLWGVGARGSAADPASNPPAGRP